MLPTPSCHLWTLFFAKEFFAEAILAAAASWERANRSCLDEGYRVGRAAAFLCSMAAFVLGLAGQIALSQAHPQPPPSLPTVMIIRHGEKVSHVGCLNQTGLARASALPQLFDGRRRPGKPTLSVPDALFAHMYTSPICQRCIQTLEPIAKAHQLSIDSRFGYTALSADPARSGTTMVAAAIRHALASHPTVLVAWEHHSIANLTMALGVPLAVLPGAPTLEDTVYSLWPDDDFDTVYLLTFPGGASGSPNLTVTREGLACHAGSCHRTDRQVERARDRAEGALVEPFPQAVV